MTAEMLERALGESEGGGANLLCRGRCPGQVLGDRQSACFLLGISYTQSETSTLRNGNEPTV
jgi:hypothetical protein